MGLCHGTSHGTATSAPRMYASQLPGRYLAEIRSLALWIRMSDHGTDCAWFRKLMSDIINEFYDDEIFDEVPRTIAQKDVDSDTIKIQRFVVRYMSGKHETPVMKQPDFLLRFRSELLNYANEHGYEYA